MARAGERPAETLEDLTGATAEANTFLASQSLDAGMIGATISWWVQDLLAGLGGSVQSAMQSLLSDPTALIPDSAEDVEAYAELGAQLIVGRFPALSIANDVIDNATNWAGGIADAVASYPVSIYETDPPQPAEPAFVDDDQADPDGGEGLNSFDAQAQAGPLADTLIDAAVDRWPDQDCWSDLDGGQFDYQMADLAHLTADRGALTLMTWGDLDGDGAHDLFVANTACDSGRNVVFSPQPGGGAEVLGTVPGAGSDAGGLDIVGLTPQSQGMFSPPRVEDGELAVEKAQTPSGPPDWAGGSSPIGMRETWVWEGGELVEESSELLRR